MVLLRRKDRGFCRNMQEKGWKKVRNIFTFVRKPFLNGKLYGKIKRKTYLCSTILIHMKRLLITLIALCTLATAGAQRQRYNFNSDWNITFADPDTNPSAEAKKVTLPHAWNED